MKNIKRSVLLIFISIFEAIFFSTCSPNSIEEVHQQIIREEAGNMIESEADVVIVDVRTEPEYKSELLVPIN